MTEQLTEVDVRRIAREEIASLAGLVVRRTQDDEDALAEAGYDSPTATRVLAEIFGEALNDFSTDAEPGR